MPRPHPTAPPVPAPAPDRPGSAPAPDQPGPAWAPDRSGPGPRPGVPAPAPPAGAPYHRLARGVAYRWWHPLTGTAVLLAGYLGLILVLVIPLGLLGAFSTTGAPGPAGLLDLSASLVLIGAMVPAVLLATRLGRRRRAGTVSSVTGRLRLRWLGRCAAVAAAVIAAELGLLLVLDPGELGDTGRWAGLPAFALSAAVLLVLVPLQAAGEEYFARGWFVQAVGAWARSPWPGILVGGALWTAAHVPSTWWGVADLMLYSAVAGWLTVRTGGLEAAVALHAVGNLAACWVMAATGQLADDSTAGDAGWTLLAVDLLAVPLYALAVTRLHRRLGLARVAPAPGQPGPAGSVRP